MKHVKYLGWDSYEDLLEDWDCFRSFSLNYTNKGGQYYSFNVEEDGRGVNITEENTGEYHEETFDSLEELFDNFHMPDGVLLRDVVNGENWIE